MSETTAAPPLYTSIVPSAAAMEWAKQVTEEFAQGYEALGARSWAYRYVQPGKIEEFLGLLHAPELPELIEECDRIVHAHAPEPAPGGKRRFWFDAPRARLDEVVDRCDDDLKTRLLLWFMLNTDQPRHKEVDEQGWSRDYFAPLHHRTASELPRRVTPRDGTLLALLLHAMAQEVIEPDRIHACERAEDHVLPEGDTFGDRLREHEPVLDTHPGLAELFVHLLTLPGARPSREWREGLRRRLAAIPDAEDVVRRLLEVVLRTPQAEHGSYNGTKVHFLHHVHNIVNGLVWAVQEQASESEDWSLSLLERVAMFSGTGPGGSKMLRSERTASACVRILCRARRRRGGRRPGPGPREGHEENPGQGDRRGPGRPDGDRRPFPTSTGVSCSWRSPTKPREFMWRPAPRPRSSPRRTTGRRQPVLAHARARPRRHDAHGAVRLAHALYVSSFSF